MVSMCNDALKASAASSLDAEHYISDCYLLAHQVTLSRHPQDMIQESWHGRHLKLECVDHLAYSSMDHLSCENEVRPSLMGTNTGQVEVTKGFSSCSASSASKHWLANGSQRFSSPAQQGNLHVPQACQGNVQILATG